MFEKSKLQPEKGEQEPATKMGARAIEKEAGIESPKRRGGYLMTTFLAMGLAMAGADQAQARNWESLVFGPRGAARTVIGEASKAADQHAREKRQQIDREYVEQRDQIEENIRALERNYQEEKREYLSKNDQQSLHKLEPNYRKERADLMKLKIQNEEKWEKGKNRLKGEGWVKDRIMIGIRGW